ncbi:MAG: helix-turn-helix transcriptional regulator [Streptococcus mutans]|uniref:helix-turn-helix transcriptional regulator n=1 Tax=Streptococcus mutans TaxID=1309 RepID=UPI000313944E|nr:YafY family protein [Streptococcus mutans]MCB4935508.1 YafY family transcriptional regulator [Streptococcus mutans]MCB4986366.1 YafY family transcriptional regulator [Streptococcus mutans]MCB4987076.1 YafY family transcriptional regulator [Streptococcus mutans]MCB5010049.1 YafY family transcriptional regulator [Streptococcus mutans]MDB8632989.1 YafY family protein [Streptococcus mutans]
MKLERLLAILSLLSDRNRITAKELAEKFEVSKRTIYRDLESLNQAGIPIVSYAGRDGGFSLMKNYQIDKRILSKADTKNLYSALKGLQSIKQQPELIALIAKLLPEEKSNPLADYDINFSSWYADSLIQKKIKILQKAIEERICVLLDYISSSGRRKRKIEPYQLVFKDSAWYLHAFCHKRQAFRLFKLRRMASLTLLEEKFTGRPYPALTLKSTAYSDFSLEPVEGYDKVVLTYHPEDAFAITKVMDASILAASEKEGMVTFYTSNLAMACDLVFQLLTKVSVLAPIELQQLVEKKLDKIKSFYKR